MAKLSEADKKKARKARHRENLQARRAPKPETAAGAKPAKEDGEEDVEIEYVSAPLELPEPEAAPDVMDEDEHMGLGGAGLGMGGLGFAEPQKEDPMAEFRKVFERFATAEELTSGAPYGDSDGEEGEEGEGGEGAKRKKVDEAKAGAKGGDASGSDSDGEDKKALSKRQRKMLSRLKIAELKQLCERPDVVEVWDVTSPDPQLLVFLKGYRNTVHVPRHWSQKRKYLQGKRGLEKPPFKLPDFIEATGIGEMRQSYSEKEESKKLKAKQRDRMAPKMGRMDIDYQVLHDAFFKFQTRPKLTIVGDLYYEGKEFEAVVGNLRPGVLSDALRESLGMGESTPPPWLINMQRYGPPPSYPDLKIAGLNAPIPPGASFGYQPGGWGKPPVDEAGAPVYGDVFGQLEDDGDEDEAVDRVARWGELDAAEEEESSEEADEEMDDEDIEDGIATGLMSGMHTGLVSGIASSLPSGLETPDTMLNLRKQSESEAPKQLYQVLEQKHTGVGANTIMGTDHVYVIPGTQTADGGEGAGKAGKGSKKLGMLAGLPTDVDVALTPEEIEGLDEAALKELYDAKVAEARGGGREDFSDMVAAKAAQQKKKIAERADKKSKSKDFKF
ncbi:hypothetical protein FOA52_014687 [Chlamydomonas sp. UWO 241]|nr:hypothetical protein FOA52_014687 [Chlamydomonas sp. UWO 241]